MIKRPMIAFARLPIPHSRSAAVKAAPWGRVRRSQRQRARAGGAPFQIPTLRIAAAQVQKIDPADIAAMMEGLRSCLTSLRSGNGHITQVLEFQYATMSAVLIERQGVVRGLSGTIAAAESTITALRQRAEPASGRVGALFGPEIASLDEFIRLHQYQLAQLSKGEYEKVLRSLAGRLGGKIQLAIGEIDNRRA